MSASVRPTPRAKRVWERLHDWYGSRLFEQFGTEPPRDWCEVVDRTDNDDVKRGLSIIRAEYPAHPPTFPQFEVAFRPSAKPQGRPHGPTMQERLAIFVVKNHRLTPRQLRGPWTYLYARKLWFDKTLKQERDEAAECSGVVIPADEAAGAPSLRVMVVDMALESAA